MRKIKSFPVLLIVMGFIILLETTGAYNGAVLRLWPILLVSVGTVKIINSFIEEKQKN